MTSWIRRSRSLLQRLSYHPGNDNSEHWKSRATAPGESAVWFKNEALNRCIRSAQFRILEPYLWKLPQGAHVLDLGCGTGVVTRHMLQVRSDLRIVAIDFPQMIDRARAESVQYQGVEWICQSATEFKRFEQFDLVVSVGSISMIRHEPDFWQAIENVSVSVVRGGIVLLIDPFHTSNFLARVKVSPTNVRRSLQARGFNVDQHRGITFWPLREMISNTNTNSNWTERLYCLGEAVIALPGLDLLSDYKVIIGEKL